MTGAEWMVCKDPGLMLDSIRFKVSERKVRLFACGCVRRIENLLTDQRALDALEIAERYADGFVVEAKRSEARKADQQVAQSRSVTSRPTFHKWERRAASAVYYATARNPSEAAWNARQFAIEALIWKAGGFTGSDARAIDESEKSLQAELIRDIFGIPLAKIAFHRDWLSWNNGTLPKLAQSIYDDRAFDRLPILADALEDAGCDNPDILAHCRGLGPHVRGCWVIDLILGKE
jgi:hypothetical protein